MLTPLHTNGPRGRIRPGGRFPLLRLHYRGFGRRVDGTLGSRLGSHSASLFTRAVTVFEFSILAFVLVRSRSRSVLRHTLTFEHRVRNLYREERDGTKRIIVSWNHVVDEVRVAVRVDDRDHRDTKAPGFRNGDLFILGVDDDKSIGQPRHLLDTRKILID